LLVVLLRLVVAVDVVVVDIVVAVAAAAFSDAVAADSDSVSAAVSPAAVSVAAVSVAVVSVAVDAVDAASETRDESVDLLFSLSPLLVDALFFSSFVSVDVCSMLWHEHQVTVDAIDLDA